MISNYLYTIGKYLSPSKRQEVLREIESNLYDYLEESYGKQDYTDTQIERAIRAMGHPKEVAMAYRNGEPALISSSYVESFWILVQISVFGTAIGLIIANMLSFSAGDSGIRWVLGLVAQIWQVSLSITGMFTMVFAVISRLWPNEISRIEKEWSLDILETAPQSNAKVNITEIVVEMIFICIALVALNQLSFFANLENTNAISIINAMRFIIYLPWINAISFFWLLLNIYLLIKRTWQMQTRVIAIFIDLISIVLFAVFAFDPYILDIITLPHHLARLQSTLYIGFACFVCITGYEICKHLKVLMDKAKT